MKRFVFFVVFLLFIIMPVNAQTREENATKWLDDNIAWSQTSTEELSFATIVLNSQRGLSQLNNKMNSENGCFPKTDCNTKETALATLALKSMNQPIDKQLKYLNNSLKIAPFNSQDWNIQVVSNEAGSCTVKYEESANGITFNFDENGKLNDGSSWINFNQLNGFNFNKNSEDINIACTFASIPKISIIKILGNSFYIIEEQTSKNVNFRLKNGCYSFNPGSANCDEESSFYASFVLSKLGLGIDTKDYLKDNVNNDIEYSLLSIIDNKYLPILVSRQKEDGSFNDIYTTSFAYGALKNSNYQAERDKSKIWIEKQQNNDGRIGTGVKDTAVALYFVYTNLLSPGDGNDEPGEGCLVSSCNPGYSCNPINGLCELETQQQCNTNLRCEPLLGENLASCPIDCYCNRNNVCDPTENQAICPLDCLTQEQESVCGNSRCEVGEDETNCSLDCEPQGPDSGGEEKRCGDGICDEFDEDENNCSLDCEPEKKSSLLWLWIIVIILALGGIAFIVLTKLKKKGSKESSPSYLGSGMPPNYPEQRTYKPVQRPRKDEALDNELDKSIREAQELLRKKK